MDFVMDVDGMMVRLAGETQVATCPDAHRCYRYLRSGSRYRGPDAMIPAWDWLVVDEQ
jgi:hypothetical protein